MPAAIALCLVLMGSAPPPADSTAGPERDARATEASCGSCAAAVQTNGWCEKHAVGYVAAVPIRSLLLYQTMDAHGHDIDPSTITCPDCRRARDTHGFCETHRIGFVRRQAYFSYLTWAQAGGEPKRAEEISCLVCRKNAASRGWCDHDRLGMIGPVAIRDRDVWQRAARAATILESAEREASRCEQCAMAMVTDTECPICRITWKDGKRVSPPGKP